MARVTVEDCVTKVPNRFELVMLAAQRARDLAAGAEMTVEEDNDKRPVVSLREIAEEKLELDTLEDSLIQGLQRYVPADEPIEDEMDMAALQQEVQGDLAQAVAEEGDEVIADVLTVHDVAAEDSDAAKDDFRAMMEGAEISED